MGKVKKNKNKNTDLFNKYIQNAIYKR